MKYDIWFSYIEGSLHMSDSILTDCKKWILMNTNELQYMKTSHKNNVSLSCLVHYMIKSASPSKATMNPGTNNMEDPQASSHSSNTLLGSCCKCLHCIWRNSWLFFLRIFTLADHWKQEFVINGSKTLKPSISSLNRPL